ncbi:hypothetical protein NT6N_19420 [Oceaniferula spumae]|uniref:Uncharacterized protein n=1 Tax=Oceaniferula spumae TaxID=2979115 RepID=A0AAT9FLV5_9BACT
MFTQSFIHILVVVALAWTAIGGLVLVALLIRDWIKGTLW